MCFVLWAGRVQFVPNLLSYVVGENVLMEKYTLGIFCPTFCPVNTFISAHCEFFVETGRSSFFLFPPQIIYCLEANGSRVVLERVPFYFFRSFGRHYESSFFALVNRENVKFIYGWRVHFNGPRLYISWIRVHSKMGKILLHVYIMYIRVIGSLKHSPACVWWNKEKRS